MTDDQDASKLFDPPAVAKFLRVLADEASCRAANSRLVAGLLQSEMEKFQKRDPQNPHNVYAVRMAVDHKNSANSDEWDAAMLNAAADIIATNVKG